MYQSISGTSNAAASNPLQQTQTQPSAPFDAPTQTTISIDDLGLPPASSAGQTEDSEAFQSRQFEQLQTIHTRRADTLAALARKCGIGARVLSYTLWIPPFVAYMTTKSDEEAGNFGNLLAAWVIMGMSTASLLLWGAQWMLERVAQSLRTESQTLREEFQPLLTA